VAEAETGVVAVEVTADGERIMRSSRGANMDLSPNDVARLSRAKPTLVHLAGYSLLGPFGLEILRSAGRLAQSTGAKLSFDPSSPGVIELFGPEPLLDAMVAAGVEILLPNAEEARALIGARTPETAGAQLAGSIPVVIVKDGSRGAVYSTAGVTQRVPVDPLQPLDTTGAGDAFNAGVLAALVEQKTLAVACLQAHETARRVLRHCGGRP
jgi:sugar/nucleoside kinase (ribokinase family)